VSLYGACTCSCSFLFAFLQLLDTPRVHCYFAVSLLTFDCHDILVIDHRHFAVWPGCVNLLEREPRYRVMGLFNRHKSEKEISAPLEGDGGIDGERKPLLRRPASQ
jgi:hypothetical protein